MAPEREPGRRRSWLRWPWQKDRDTENGRADDTTDTTTRARELWHDELDRQGGMPGRRPPARENDPNAGSDLEDAERLGVPPSSWGEGTPATTGDEPGDTLRGLERAPWSGSVTPKEELPEDEHGTQGGHAGRARRAGTPTTTSPREAEPRARPAGE
jgi:hypothetical protein